MKKERLEELVESVSNPFGDRHGTRTLDERIRSAILAVERETVERCARFCDRWSGVGDTQVAQPLAIAIRSLLTEDTIGGALDEK